jgi:signal transduction histidine kinase
MMVMIYDKTGMMITVNAQKDMAENKTDVKIMDSGIGTPASQ